jgi:DNA-binding NarL/FixJ family response regulator
LRVREFHFKGEELAVLSFPRPCLDFPPELSRAERDVAHALVEGLSNGAIAKRRGTSTRTVANQVAGLFRKLRVGSRAEFLMALARHQTSPR